MTKFAVFRVAYDEDVTLPKAQELKKAIMCTSVVSLEKELVGRKIKGKYVDSNFSVLSSTELRDFSYAVMSDLDYYFPVSSEDSMYKAAMFMFSDDAKSEDVSLLALAFQSFVCAFNADSMAIKSFHSLNWHIKSLSRLDVDRADLVEGLISNKLHKWSKRETDFMKQCVKRDAAESKMLGQLLRPCFDEVVAKLSNGW